MKLKELPIMARTKVWFITGISRGLGKTLATAVLAIGDTVIGTTRDGTSDLEADRGQLHVLPLDVTKAEDVKLALEAAHKINWRLDVIVNNAGYGLLGAIEESSVQDINDVFAVNFFGTMHVVQAALPYLREQKSGHIINITSIAGLAPMAGSGFYAAAKFAVEGMTQSLAQEVQPLGIDVTLVEPGAFRTDFLSAQSIKYAENVIDDYEETSGQVVATLSKIAGNQLGDPELAAHAIINIVNAQQPPLHLVLGTDALNRTRTKLRQMVEEIDKWAPLTVSTDFRETKSALAV
jgi:NAD(P)-dependent dehydrogenase (short-subunit alcohol dehydrogenase family)